VVLLRCGGLAGDLHLTASGGDPLTAAQLVAIFESFAEGELQSDLAARKAEHGDLAEAHPLPRTQSQRNFDALVTIFTAAAGSTQAGKLPEPTVNVIIDDATLHDTLTHAGITLPNGHQIDLDEHGNPIELLADLVADLADNPEALADRVCNLSTGAPIHPTVALRALLTGHVRRVVVDSANVVTELGTRKRVFTGAAREAALLLASFCTHSGCNIRGRHSQVDHGNHRRWAPQVPSSCSLTLSTPSIQRPLRNAQARCGPHNRFKHRERWQSKRDERGRTYDIRPDNTIFLPVGDRPPDLTHHDLNELARKRLRQLCTS
jgi:hypothetical protein